MPYIAQSNLYLRLLPYMIEESIGQLIHGRLEITPQLSNSFGKILLHSSL